MFSLYSIVSKFVSFISVSFVITLNASNIIQVNKKVKELRVKTAENIQVEFEFMIFKDSWFC